MFDVVLESFRAFILIGLYLYLNRFDRHGRIVPRAGWNAIMGGFALLIFASVLDITDNFDSLNTFVVIGDTPVEAFLEKVVGYLGGFLMLAYGLIRWMPSSQRIASEAVAREYGDINKTRAEQIIKRAVDAIVSINSDQLIVSYNEAAQRMFGYTRDEVIGQPLAFILPQGTENKHAAMVRKFSASQETGKWMGNRKEIRGLRKNGEEFFAEGSITKQEIADGVEFTVILQDVTSRKQAEQAIQESKDRLEDAQRIAHLGHWNWDIASSALTWSPEIYRIFGLNELDFTPTYESFLSRVHPDDCPIVEKSVGQAFEGKPYSIEHRIILPDGTERYVNERGEVKFNEDGEPLSMAGTVHDITDKKLADMAHRESEERFSLAMRGANDGLWDWNLKTDDVYYSPRWGAMLGYQPEELEPTLDTWVRLVDPNDKDRVLEEVRNYVEGDANAFDTEFRMRHKDGSWLTILSRAFLAHDSGDAARLVGTHVDITEIKKSERLLQALVEGTSTSTGADFFHHLTQSLAEGLGVDYAFIGEVPPDAPDSVRTMSVWAKGGVGENIEYKLAGTPCENVVGKDACCYSDHVQQLFPTDHLLVEMGVESYAGVPLFSSDGTALGLLVALGGKPMQNLETVKSMLTIFSARAGAELERERATSGAKAARDTLTDAIESLPDAFVLYDKDDRLVICNEKYRTFYPKSAPIMRPGKTFEEIIRYGIERGEYAEALGSPEQQKAWLADRLEKHCNPQEIIEQHISDGRWLRVRETKTSDGGTVGFRIDITDLKNTEKELIEYKDHLEDLVVKRSAEVHKKAEELEQALESEKKYSAMQQQFVSLVSHEFRTPLTIIDSNAQRLIRRKDDTSTEQLVERSKKIRLAVERMVVLIDTTLYASRLDAGKIQMKRGPCDLAVLVNEVCDRQAEISPSHDIRLDLDDVPPMIIADAKLLEHVFTNLLSNAVKYAPDSPLIEVRGWSEDAWVSVSVKDHGIGIPGKDLLSMFERYFRAKTAEGFKGTGLGLNISKEFTEMHGGTIEVDSVEGEGSTFTLRLPSDMKGP